MPSLIDSASAILSAAESRLEASAQNIANASTKGFKRQVSFSEVLAGAAEDSTEPAAFNTLVDFTQGRLIETGNPLDLAISGPGLLQLRDGDVLIYSRGGTFARDEDGRLADAVGRILQQAGGGDLAVKGDSLSILEDGTLIEDGLPTGKIALYETIEPATLSALGGTTFAADPVAMDEAASSQLRQGFTEASNVVMSEEMIAMMASVRRAESGGRLVQFYDHLIGQAITTFSRSGK